MQCTYTDFPREPEAWYIRYFRLVCSVGFTLTYPLYKSEPSVRLFFKSKEVFEMKLRKFVLTREQQSGVSVNRSAPYVLLQVVHWYTSGVADNFKCYVGKD